MDETGAFHKIIRMVEFSSFDMFRIQNGKIVEEREETDMLSFYQKVGMELKPKAVKK